MAVDYEQTVLRRIGELRAQGASLRAICSALEAEGHRTKRGGSSWQPAVVGRLIKRLVGEGGASAASSPGR